MLEPTTPTLGSCFAFARNKLDEPDARALCEEALSVDFSGLIAGADSTVTNAQFKRLRDFVRRRSEGEPVAYIVRSKGFWRHEFAVSSDTLIPRPETEALVETVLPFLSSESSVLDLGTGSGAIGLSIAAETGAHVLLTDLSCTALQVAAENAATLDISVQFRQSNWYDAIDESFDCIVSNPPYVASHDKHLETGDLPYEPHLALDGGLDGLEALRAVVGEAPNHLRPRGRLMVEHGFDQADAVGTLFRAAGFRRIGLVRDLSNHPRVTHGLLP